MVYNPTSSPIQAVAIEPRLHGTNVLYRHGASSDKGQACVGLMAERVRLMTPPPSMQFPSSTDL
jgi:hypothetical protein